jgi:UDP-4-amino-4,6-dideoxy-N-acetyl-beta-L-altrosamine transaminase
MIPYGKQDVTKEDIDAVVSVLKSDFLTQGKEVPEFEQLLSAYCTSKYAVAVNSATSALHIACLSLGLVKGDWLWTTPITFVASANCAIYCGAKVDFVDIDVNTYNLSYYALEEKLIKAEKEGKLPKIVVPVHFTGQSCEMKGIYKLSKKYGFKIIEDASHAIGGRYCGKPIGNCQYSDITIFSFHPVKIITTGEGGAAVTNNKILYDKMLLLRSHGITRDSGLINSKADELWVYNQIELGFNYRMTDIQASLGKSQIKRLNKYVSKRHKIAGVYNKSFDDLLITTPYQHTDTFSAYHLYVICLRGRGALQILRKKLFNTLLKSKIGVNVHYIPVHLQPYYQKMGFKIGDFPNAEEYYNTAISLPMYPTLDITDQSYVVSELRSFFVK